MILRPIPILLATAAMLAAPAAAEACRDAHKAPAQLGAKTARAAALCLINARRAERGLSQLRGRRNLNRAAIRHARDMRRRNYFSHISPGGRDPVARIRATGYMRGARAWLAGENMRWGTGRLATPARTVRAWMRSPGHRRVLLRRGWRHIGIGFTRGTPTRMRRGGVWVADFGYRR